MFLSVKKVAIIRLNEDENVEHSLLIVQRQTSGAGPKTAELTIQHNAVNSIRYAETVVNQLSVEERDSKKRHQSSCSTLIRVRSYRG